MSITANIGAYNNNNNITGISKSSGNNSNNSNSNSMIVSFIDMLMQSSRAVSKNSSGINNNRNNKASDLTTGQAIRSDKSSEAGKVNSNPKEIESVFKEAVSGIFNQNKIKYNDDNENKNAKETVNILKLFEFLGISQNEAKKIINDFIVDNYKIFSGLSGGMPMDLENMNIGEAINLISIMSMSVSEANINTQSVPEDVRQILSDFHEKIKLDMLRESDEPRESGEFAAGAVNIAAVIGGLENLTWNKAFESENLKASVIDYISGQIYSKYSALNSGSENQSFLSISMISENSEIPGIFENLILNADKASVINGLEIISVDKTNTQVNPNNITEAVEVTAAVKAASSSISSISSIEDKFNIMRKLPAEMREPGLSLSNLSDLFEVQNSAKIANAAKIIDAMAKSQTLDGADISRMSSGTPGNITDVSLAGIAGNNKAEATAAQMQGANPNIDGINKANGTIGINGTENISEYLRQISSGVVNARNLEQSVQTAGITETAGTNMTDSAKEISRMIAENMANNKGVNGTDITDGNFEVKMKLTPKELGELLIKVSYNKGDIILNITAANKAAGLGILNRISELRESLAMRGINLTNIEVGVNGGEVDYGGQQSYYNQNNKNSPNSQDSGGNNNFINNGLGAQSEENNSVYNDAARREIVLNHIRNQRILHKTV